MPTSARWAAANLPKISEKTVHPAGAMWASPPTTGACKFALHIHKNILPSRRFGTRAYLLRGATQIRKRLDTSLLRKGCGLRGPGDFGAVRLIRLLGGCPSRCCCKGLSASWPSLWAGRKPVLLPRRRKIKLIGSFSCSSSSCANPDRRAAIRGSAFLPRPGLSRTGRWTNRTGEACA